MCRIYRVHVLLQKKDVCSHHANHCTKFYKFSQNLWFVQECMASLACKSLVRLWKSKECLCELSELEAQIYTRNTRLPIPPHVLASSAMGLNLGVFGFLPTAHAKANAKQMRSRSLCALWLLMRDWILCFTLRPQTAGNTQRPPNWAPCRDQDAAGSGISGKYLWLVEICGMPALFTHFISRCLVIKTKNQPLHLIRSSSYAFIWVSQPLYCEPLHCVLH